MKNIFILAAIFCVLFAQVWADEGDYTVSVTDEHKVLHKGKGKWKVVQKMWFDPSQPEPMIATGTSFSKVILNGLVTITFVETTSDAGTFKGYGVFTWNVAEKKYECSWVDVYSYYGIDHMEGTYDKTSNTFTWTGMFRDGASGQEFEMTMVEKFADENTMVSEFFIDMQGQKIKTMENTYIRVSKDDDNDDDDDDDK